jgi:uncharacterized protein (DUF697 family)
MLTVLPSSRSHLHEIPTFKRHVQPVIVQQTALHTDTFSNSERQKLLTILKNPQVFEAVLDESHKASPEVKALRHQLARKKISTKELFESPELLINFYSHLEKQINAKLKHAKTPEEQEDLKIQALMMKSMVSQLQKHSGLTSFQAFDDTELTKSLVSKKGLKSNTPKFGGLFVGLFTEINKIFTEQGDWRKTTPGERRQKGTKIINKGSAIAAITAGGLSKLMFADDAALTAVTVSTISKMAYGVYGIDSASEAFLGVVVGKLAGARLADGLIDYAIEKGLGLVPILGEIATATTAYGLHQATGRLFLEYFEHQISSGKSPGLPTSLSALTSVIGLADASNAIDFDGMAQEKHYNTLNQARVESGNYHNTAHSFMDTSIDNRCFEINNILDNQGNLFGHPDKDWFFNELVYKAENIHDAAKLFELIGKTPRTIINKAVREMKENKGLSTGTLKEIVDATGDSIAAKLTLLGDGSVNKPGFLEWLEEARDRASL